MVLRRSRFPLLVHKLIRYIFQNVFHEFFRERSCYFSDNGLRRVLNLMNYLYKLSQYMSSQYFRMKRTKQCTVSKACQIQTCIHKILILRCILPLHRRIWDFIWNRSFSTAKSVKSIHIVQILFFAKDLFSETMSFTGCWVLTYITFF